MNILAASRIDTTNIGDLVSSPCLYFDYDASPYDVKQPLPPADVYIYGGGEIVDNVLKQDVSGIQIAWGMGAAYLLEDFALLGSRDVGAEGAAWVPCASCMSPLFDQEYAIQHEQVMYLNSRDTALPQLPMPVLTNRCSFTEAIAFLGSAALVITDSYHGAYWATLLGRAAIITRPNRNKFYHYRHQPVMTKWKIRPRVFPNALTECREANIQFDKKVRELING